MAIVHHLNDIAAEDGADGPMEHWEDHDRLRNALRDMRDTCQKLMETLGPDVSRDDDV